MNFIIKDPEILDEQLEPIGRYIEECMARSAEDAVRLIGMQGGYIDIPLNMDFNPSRYVNPDGLGIIKLPYWFYKGNRYVPTIAAVQREISTYVEEHTNDCIDDFNVFKDEYQFTEIDDMKVTTFLNKNDISIVMEYPIRVYYRTNKTYTLLEKFSTSVPVRLRKTIEIANKILDSEVRYAFLENFTIDLMASNPNVPFTDMKFTCKVLEWDIFGIKRQVEEMLFYNLPRIRVKNTDYRPFLEEESEYKKLLEYHMEDIAEGNYPKNVPEDACEYLHMFWDAGLDKESMITVGFKFLPEVGMDLIGRPHDNGILRSKLVQGSKQYIRFLCVNAYHFIYDANYPVITTIRDDVSFNGEGYLFSFAMPVTIHNNEPYKINYGYDMFTTTYYDRGFCADRGDNIADIRVYGKEQGYSNVELDEVNISLQCFKYHCDLGQTTADQGSYRLRTTLPASCSNPFIIAEKEGYLKAKKQLTDEDGINLELTKLKELDYEVVFHRYNSIGDSLESEQPLEDDMNVSIQIISDDFEQYKLYPIENKIELIEGDAAYELDIALTQSEEYIGGYKGKWKVSGLDVANSDKVIFHIIKYVPFPFTQEDKLKMMAYLLMGDYNETIAPELI